MNSEFFFSHTSFHINTEELNLPYYLPKLKEGE